MEIRAEWIQLAVLGLFALFFVWVAVAALRKARRRRHEELRESPAEELVARDEQQRLAEATAAEEREPEAPQVAPAVPEAAPAPEVEPPAGPAAAAAREPDEALTRGLSRTSASFRDRLGQIFRRHPKVDPSIVDELEEALLTADVGVAMTTRLIAAVRADIQAQRLGSSADVERALKEHMMGALRRDGGRGGDPLAVTGPRPRVILFVGVNGVGKTTTIGKVAALARSRGLDVVLAAGDTFRAAAVEQLAIWGERTHSRVIRGEANADPASVVFNAVEHASQAKADLVLADTAGRLHTKTQLMEEIKKVKRSAGKAREGAPDEVWLVVDATTGQNALQQAREFHEKLGLTGVILTKLDGTAKGGVVVGIAEALHVPVRFVGVGEKPEDLRPFEAGAFVSAMFS